MCALLVKSQIILEDELQNHTSARLSHFLEKVLGRQEKNTSFTKFEPTS